MTKPPFGRLSVQPQAEKKLERKHLKINT
ncbi:hypothetical protein CCP4SC76_5010013 [Gammaproteobacteria bacterium]